MDNLRILFVEDHAVFAAQVCRQFLSMHDVRVAPTLEQARSALAENEFEIVLIDYDLPDGKGDALVGDVQAKQPSARIIAVSSHDFGNNSIQNAGAHAICSKMNFDQIQQTLDAVRSR